MADANQLKIEARRKEASGDYAAASQLYQRALAAMDEGNSLPDPSLLVRVADLEYRQDDADSALSYYHRAVEDYAEQGLITNAIAVCNKILRVFPDEIGCYRRLADLHMDVGLVAEARQNMLRYVDQAWEEGDTDPALEAMEELLGRSPDQEIALKMATCLARLDREEDALEVLARVWRERTKADADVEALERKARDLDPDVDLDAWLPEAEEDAEDAGLAAADSFVPDETDESADVAPDEMPDAAEDEAIEATDDVAADAGDDAIDAAEDEAADAGDDVAADATDDAEPEPAADETPARSPLDELAEAARGLTEHMSDAATEDEHATAGESVDDGAADAPEAPSDGVAGEPHEDTAREWVEPPQWDEDAPEWDEAGEHEQERQQEADRQREEDRQHEEAEPWTADWSSGEPAEPAAQETEGLQEDAPGRPEHDEDAHDESEAGDASVAATEPATIANRLGGVEQEARELELVASFPEWFTEMATTRPSNGAPPGPAESRTDSWEERTMDELEELEARAEAELAGADQELEAGGPRGALDDDPGGGGVDRERSADIPSADMPGGPEPRRNEPADGALGEEEELRRGLELLDDLLEVDPDNTELKERKVRYARRLGDEAELVEAYLDLADAMAERGSRRGARLLYQKVLDLDEGNAQAEAGLGRLDRGELELKRQTGSGSGSAEPPAGEVSPEAQEARRQLGMRLWTEFEKAVQEMPWLHAATQTYQSTSPDAAPPVEAFEMLAHYLISGDRCREAADILEQAVRVADRSDEEIADALYYLGLAHDRLGESEKAADYYRRLEEVDPEFASVREWLPADEQGGA